MRRLQFVNCEQILTRCVFVSRACDSSPIKACHVLLLQSIKSWLQCFPQQHMGFLWFEHTRGHERSSTCNDVSRPLGNDLSRPTCFQLVGHHGLSFSQHILTITEKYGGYLKRHAQLCYNLFRLVHTPSFPSFAFWHLKNIKAPAVTCSRRRRELKREQMHWTLLQ